MAHPAQTAQPSPQFSSHDSKIPLPLLSALICVFCGSAEAAEGTKPNVIFIFTNNKGGGQALGQALGRPYGFTGLDLADTFTDFNPTWTRDGTNTPVWNLKNREKGGYQIMAGRIGGKPGEEIALTGNDYHAWVHSAARMAAFLCPPSRRSSATATTS